MLRPLLDTDAYDGHFLAVTVVSIQPIIALRILLLRAVHAIVLRVQWTWKLIEAALHRATSSTSSSTLATEETPTMNPASEKLTRTLFTFKGPANAQNNKRRERQTTGITARQQRKNRVAALKARKAVNV